MRSNFVLVAVCGHFLPVDLAISVLSANRVMNDLLRSERLNGMEKTGEFDLSKVDKAQIKDSKVALVYGQMTEPPGARLRVALSGLTVAEYFRDQGNDVLFFVDNIFRFTQAGSEVSARIVS